LEPEGSPEEETRIRSGSTVFFFRGGDDFGRSSSAASPMFFSSESAVCSKVESWGQNWNRSRSPKLDEVSSVEDLKYACNQNKTKSSRKEVQKRNLTTCQGRSLEEPSSQLAEEGGHPEAWQESSCHHHRPRKESGRQDPLNLRPGRHLRASSKHVMSWVWWILILLELRQNRARDILHLRVGADSIGLH
jgi:hypothetical protein